MKNTWVNHCARLVAGSSVLALSLAAHVQAAEDGGLALEEIVVTAQKREQSLQDVPISITAIKGDTLNSFAAGGEDIRLLSSRIPGLNAESSNGRVAPRFYLRGLGNTDFDLAASQPVSIIMDEVVMENVVLKSFPLFDVDRVEVLRGPQGTLFGRNTPAGIVKFDTRKPTQEAEGYVSASYGMYDTATVEAAYGGPISDKLAARVSGLYMHRGDYVDNAYTGEENAMGGFVEAAARFQLLYTPTENFDALANIHIRSLDGTSALFRANIWDQGSNDFNENYDPKTVYFGDTHNNPQSYDSWGTSLKMNYELENGMTLTSISAYETANGYSLGDIDGGNDTGPGFIPFQSSTQDGIDDLDQYTQELRISGQVNDKLFTQFGFYYFDSTLVLRTTPFFVPDTVLTHKNETWALFGQAAYDMTENTTLTVGLRYTDDNKTLTGYSGAFGADIAPVDLSGSKLNWDVAVNHVMSDDLSIYARVATAFRAPTIQGRDIAFFSNPTTASEEKVISYEAGFKAELLDGRMRWNGAAFYWDMSDMQLSAVGGGGNFIQLVNADKATGYGFETDIEYLVNENFRLTAGFAYAKTELKDPNLLVGLCAQCTVTDPIVSVLADGTVITNPNNPLYATGELRASVDGNALPQAPEWTLNFTADYTVPVDDGSEVFIFTDWAFQGPTSLFLYESEEFRTDTTFEGGIRMGYRWAEGQYEVALFGRNITNEQNAKGAIDFNNLTGYVNEPRVMGIAFGAKF
ncbi:MAG: TonB-dependent receptor [Alphaproteobacteria bacterium]|nr:MAG: TonB-dependent receptor [Alphaproteobacteria bacterium]